MKVNKKSLLLLAAVVWGIAGFNVLRIGIITYPPLSFPAKPASFRSRLFSVPQDGVWQTGEKALSPNLWLWGRKAIFS